MEGKRGVSVIICCYNSATRIPETLRHLAMQRVPEDLPWEIVLVNNASTDNTVETARWAWNQHESSLINFRVVEESSPGLMHARKRGVSEAQFECLVFCDDDNWLDQDYVRLSAQMIFNDKTIGAGGGQNAPVTNAPEYPEWFPEYQDKYALGVPAVQSGYITHRGFVLGAGMVTRKSLFQIINSEKYPSLLQGRNGAVLTAGDDFEYCKRLILWGYKLYYDSNMKLKHFIPMERLTVAYRDRLMGGILEAGKVIGEYDSALHLYYKTRHKSRWRLFLLSPFRIFFARLGLSKRDLSLERKVYQYLSPFSIKSDPIKNGIKRFMHHN